MGINERKRLSGYKTPEEVKADQEEWRAEFLEFNKDKLAFIERALCFLDKTNTELTALLREGVKYCIVSDIKKLIHSIAETETELELLLNIASVKYGKLNE